VTDLPPADDPGPDWHQSLGTGAPGIALARIELARSGTGSWQAVHPWTAAITSSPVVANPTFSSLFRGAPAVAFTLHAAAQPGYQSALDTLDPHITALTKDRLGAAHARIDRADPARLHEYDLVTGLTGLGVYQLRRYGGGGLLPDVLAYLVALTEPLRGSNGETLPGWWSATGPGRVSCPRWPGGHSNHGLAHGICGPLALLSGSMRRGIEVTGQAEAIERICSWLDRWRQGSGCDAWWPETLSRAEYTADVTGQAGPGRPSWCYGTPGIARAQQLAGLALGDSARALLAEQALAGCLAEQRQLDLLTDASLCHGWAGMLQAAWRVCGDATDPAVLAAMLRRLRVRAEDFLARFGPPTTTGLLEGSAGVSLAEHTTSRTDAPPTGWDACLLLDV
jgi:hypothetical protein